LVARAREKHVGRVNRVLKGKVPKVAWSMQRGVPRFCRLFAGLGRSTRLRFPRPRSGPPAARRALGSERRLHADGQRFFGVVTGVDGCETSLSFDCAAAGQDSEQAPWLPDRCSRLDRTPLGTDAATGTSGAPRADDPYRRVVDCVEPWPRSHGRPWRPGAAGIARPIVQDRLLSGPTMYCRHRVSAAENFARHEEVPGETLLRAKESVDVRSRADPCRFFRRPNGRANYVP